MRVLTTITVAAVLLLAGCSSDNDTPATSAATPTPVAPTATPTVDPYAVYLSKAAKGEPKLSREDASTRALLGCGQKWPPGTVDAVLAEAYAEYCPK
jgi:hypothetical protein